MNWQTYVTDPIIFVWLVLLVTVVFMGHAFTGRLPATVALIGLLGAAGIAAGLVWGFRWPGLLLSGAGLPVTFSWSAVLQAIIIGAMLVLVAVSWTRLKKSPGWQWAGTTSTGYIIGAGVHTILRHGEPFASWGLG